MKYQCLEDFTEELKAKISNINEQRKAFFSRSSDDLYSDLVAQNNYLLNDTIYSNINSTCINIKEISCAKGRGNSIW